MPKSRVVLERPSGSGRVLDGGNWCADVSYSLTVWQEMLDAGSEQVPGLIDVSGVLHPENGDLPWNAGSLLLELEDGRKLNFLVSNSTMGSAAPTTHYILGNGALE